MSAAASKRWRQRHPEAVRKQKRLYYQRSFHRLRGQRNMRNKQRLISLLEQVYDLLGRKCSRCGFSDWRALQIDHRNGGGCKHREQFKNRDQFLRAVLKDPHLFQLLCANCNWIKRHEEHEFGSGPPRRVKELC